MRILSFHLMFTAWTVNGLALDSEHGTALQLVHRKQT